MRGEMTIFWSKSTKLSSTLRQCFIFQYLWTLSAVKLHVFRNPFHIVSINLLFCELLHPATRIRSGEVSTMLSLAPNVANRVANLTLSSMSSDFMMSVWKCSVRNTFRSACKMAAGLWEMASEALCHFLGQC